MSTKSCVRCEAVKPNGERCRKTTCKYARMCWLHTRQKKGLAVRKSRIYGAGDGLFATRVIPKGSLIDEYKGEQITPSEYKKRDTNYGLQLNKNVVIDGRDTQANLARYANDCRSKNIKKKECKGSNAKFAIDNKRQRASLRARRKIKNGEEIYVSYSASYWR